MLTMPPFVLACPLCTSPLSSSLSCSACGRDYSCRDGIYRFLVPERQEALQLFVSQYRVIRNLDGYRSRPAQYYRWLPHTNPRDPQAQTWRVRTETFEHLLRWVLESGGPNSAKRLDALGEPGRSNQRARSKA